MVNTITFGGVTSSTYDIYISGEGVWSAPARDAEMVTIPGRNGAFVHDKERFENIEVTYPAFIVKDNNTNFRTKIDDFRNAMCAKVGYQKLVDTFHPSEYRMAALVDGMEISPILYNDHAATFDITFNCKPQRFLTTGDTAVAVANNGTITNPTLFDAKPQLQVWGYGNINVNGYDIAVNNVAMGDIVLKGTQTSTTWLSFDSSLVDSGDTIYLTFAKADVDSEEFYKTISSVGAGTAPTIYKSNADYDSLTANPIFQSHTAPVRFTVNRVSFTAGTSGYLNITKQTTLTFTDSTTQTNTYIYGIVYDGSDEISFNRRYNGDSQVAYTDTGELHGISSLSALGTPTYIDCDIGESYKIVNDEPVSLDNAVEIGASIPVLSSGSNAVTYDNTVTSFKIVPRWWQV